MVLGSQLLALACVAAQRLANMDSSINRAPIRGSGFAGGPMASPHTPLGGVASNASLKALAVRTKAGDIPASRELAVAFDFARALHGVCLGFKMMNAAGMCCVVLCWMWCTVPCSQLVRHTCSSTQRGTRVHRG